MGRFLRGENCTGWRAAANCRDRGSGGRLMCPVRSALFVPAHRRDWVAKAIRVSPDAVILDIEDSVPPSFKAQAMAHLHSEIHELRDAGVGAFVRIQPLHEGTAAEIAASVTDGL